MLFSRQLFDCHIIWWWALGNENQPLDQHLKETKKWLIFIVTSFKLYDSHITYQSLWFWWMAKLFFSIKCIIKRLDSAWVLFQLKIGLVGLDWDVFHKRMQETKFKISNPTEFSSAEITPKPNLSRFKIHFLKWPTILLLER